MACEKAVGDKAAGMFLVALILLVGCVRPFGPPPIASGEPVVAREPGLVPVSAVPVSFAPLEERVNVLVADAEQADRRDRLLAARELMHAMRNTDPAAQAKVYSFLAEFLMIEERDRPTLIGVEIGPPLGGALVEEELIVPEPTPLDPTPLPLTDESGAVAAARAALSDGRNLDAFDALARLGSANAVALRREAVDGHCRVERERAGHLFLEARAMAPGGERVASLRAVRRLLAAINERFPDNSFASAIAENIVKVDADLVAAGARP